MKAQTVLFEIKDLLAKIEAAEKLITLYRTTVIRRRSKPWSRTSGYQWARRSFWPCSMPARDQGFPA